MIYIKDKPADAQLFLISALITAGIQLTIFVAVESTKHSKAVLNKNMGDA